MDTQQLYHTDFNWVKLIRILYQKKALIIFSTLLGLAVGLVFIAYTKPVYEAKIKLIAANEGDIAGLNQGRLFNDPFIKPVTARQVYFVFSNELLSDSTKKDFFKQYYLPALTQNQKKNQKEVQLYASFSKDLALVPYTKTSSERFGKYLVAIRGDDPKQVALWLTQFLTLVKERTYNKLLNGVKQNYAVAVDALESEIDSARIIAKTQRLDRIAQLMEKVSIAQLARDKTSLGEDKYTTVDGANQILSPKLALIQAEIIGLSERHSDDAFIPVLPQLQAKLKHYKSWAVNANDVSVIHLDGKIEPPSQPIEPKKQLIMMLSLVLGFMLSILGIMCHIAWRKDGAPVF